MALASRGRGGGDGAEWGVMNGISGGERSERLSKNEGTVVRVKW